MRFIDFMTKDIGIDLGTANILVTVKGKGIVLKEPSVITFDEKKQTIIAIGQEAKEMLGRTPEGIKAIRPLKDGVIADCNATQMLLKAIFHKVSKRHNLGKPRVVVGVPSGITEVEERAVEEALLQVGAKEVYLIEEPMAAAIGAGLPIAEPTGSMIVDIGGGTTEVAVVSLGGIVESTSIRIAGDELTEDIIEYVKKEKSLAIGENTAEHIKTQIGCAMPTLTNETMHIKGRHLNTGLPAEVVITSTEILQAMQESMEKIVDTIKQTLEKTPPELASDIIERGICLAGGGALIKNIDKLVHERTQITVYVAKDPLDCVVKGTEKTLEDIQKLKGVLMNARKK